MRAIQMLEHDGNNIEEKEIRFLKNNQITQWGSYPELIKKVIGLLGQPHHENFVIVMLDDQQVPLGVKLLSASSQNRYQIQPRDILEAAAKFPCKAFIIGHNYPTGDIFPKMEDRILTLMIMASAKLFKVDVVDHIIVDMNSNQYLSFLEADIINDLKQKVSGLINEFSQKK